MSTGMVIQVEREEAETLEVEVVDGGALQERYGRLAVLVMRMGAWLTGPDASRLSPAEWEARYGRYRVHLEELRRLGDELRPVTLRDRQEPLVGDALVREVLELFAA